MSTEHPLAGLAPLRPADLRESILWSPATLGKLDFLRRFADHFGIAVEDGAVNLGLDHLVSHVRADHRRFSLLLPADVALPGYAGVRLRSARQPDSPVRVVADLAQPGSASAPATLLRRFAETGLRRRRLEYDARMSLAARP